MDDKYRNIYKSCRVAGRIQPDLVRRTLAEAVLNLLNKTEDFTRGGLEDLKRLAADGKISAEEVVAYGEALAQLREVIAAAYELEYAESEVR